MDDCARPDIQHDMSASVGDHDIAGMQTAMNLLADVPEAPRVKAVPERLTDLPVDVIDQAGTVKGGGASRSPDVGLS